MNFSKAIKNNFLNFKISGRATRTEFWLYQAFLVICVITWVVLIASYLKIFKNLESLSAIITGFAMMLAFFICFLPAFFIQIRRLHDSNISGWWIVPILVIPFLTKGIIPFVSAAGYIVTIVLMCREGTKGPNRFGDDPYDQIAID